MCQQIYLGPTMSGQGITITTGSIFNGPTPPDVEKRKTIDADFAALFVSVNDVGSARNNIRNGDTFLSQCYKNVYQNYIDGKKGA